MVNNDATLNDLQVNGTVLRYVRKKKLEQTDSERQKSRTTLIVNALKSRITSMRGRNKTKPVKTEDDSSTDKDSDGDALEEKMIRALNKEKQTLRNWKNVILRVQMVKAFQLSMRVVDEATEHR